MVYLLSNVNFYIQYTTRPTVLQCQAPLSILYVQIFIIWFCFFIFMRISISPKGDTQTPSPKSCTPGNFSGFMGRIILRFFFTICTIRRWWLMGWWPIRLYCHLLGIPIVSLSTSPSPRSLTRRLGGPDLVPLGLVRVTMTIRMMMS